MQMQLKTKIIGKKIFYLKEVGSTNEFAKKIEKKEGVVIIAEKQRRGKGRLNRGWESNFGGLYISIVLNANLKNLQLLALMTSVVVEKTIKVFGINCLIKWPNDILFNEKKLCGILCELAEDFVIVGIGVNLNNEFSAEVKNKAISLKQIIGKEINIKNFTEILLQNFEKEYFKFKEGKYDEILQYWKENSMIGRRVKIDGVEGIAYDIDRDGALIIKTEKELKKVISGDCFLIG